MACITNLACTGEDTVGTCTCVLWWRAPQADVQVPRQHAYQWRQGAGQDRDLLITDNRPWIDPGTVTRAVRTAVGADDIVVRPAAALPARDRPADIQLLIGGHTIIDTDLVSHVGLQTVGAITIQRTGKGCDATLFIDATVISELRLEVCSWAADAIDAFTDSTTDELATTGWTRSRRGRWQRLCRQA